MGLECKISELKEELTAMRNENVILKEEIEELGGQNSSIMELNNKINSELELTNSQLTNKSTDFESLLKKQTQTERELIGLGSILDSANLETRLTSNEVVKLSQNWRANLKKCRTSRNKPCTRDDWLRREFINWRQPLSLQKRRTKEQLNF